MKSKFYPLLIIVLFAFQSINAQDNNIKNIKQQQVFTSFQQQIAGEKINFIDKQIITQSGFTFNKDAAINWQYTDPIGISIQSKTSEVTAKTLGAWDTNNKRISLFGDNASPLWEYAVNTEWSFPIDMTSDGEFIAYGADNEIKVFTHDNASPIWYYSFTGVAEGLCISPDGSIVYVSFENYNGYNGTTVAGFNVGEDVPIWSENFPGTNEGLVMSGDGNTLLMVQYSGENSGIRVMKAENGELIMNTPNQNQNMPAISHDAKIFARGDYSGHLVVYEYDENTESYFEKWDANLSSGTGTWVIGLSVSGDGKTIAAGTLVFLTNDYDGEMYVYNTYSSTHLWKFEGAGDEIASIDLSYDGSIIAAA
ncbi:MAG: hypothetical protein GQ527_12910 [Bacteroidales bacterium]|nr:hypothetical protein [Bacteroidales bacterium]